jgi:hypothetical protein
MDTRTPILVTGSHRSGTTWVGRILATSPAVSYIHEPFHISHDPAVCAARFDHWFTYVCEENEEPYRTPIEKMLDVASRGPGGQASALRPLIKDPLAVFSASWLSARFATRNVVMLRHPAAFAGSLKAMRWTHPFVHFLYQPLLMEHHLMPFARDIMMFARQKRDIVDQAALLWNVIHFMILKYQAAFPEWIYVRHEDLSRDPLTGFRSMFDHLELEFGDVSRQAIATHSFAQEGTDLKLNSLANIDAWKKRLTDAEIARLKSQVQDVARQFYSDREW